MTDIKTTYILDVLEALKNDQAVRKQIMETFGLVERAAADAGAKAAASFNKITGALKNGVKRLAGYNAAQKKVIATLQETSAKQQQVISNLVATGAQADRTGSKIKETGSEAKGSIDSTTASVKELEHALRRAGTGGSGTGGKIKSGNDRARLSVNRLTKAYDRLSAAMSGGWWSRFGQVAAGFTVAYRAVNLLEHGVRKVTDLFREAVAETGELVSLQGKLAFWQRLHAEDAMSFAEAYRRAGVNVSALYKESFRSLSTLGDLTTGMEEIAQTIGSIPPKLIPELVSVIDFTTLVAQTTGSTTRQIRQELQALTQGEVRTTNILIRSMINIGVLTRKDVADLKNMKNQGQAIEKVFKAIHKEWIKLADEIIKADPTKALEVWEKTARRVFIEAIRGTSAIEGVKNIFAEVYRRRTVSMMDEFSDTDWARITLTIKELAEALDWVLGLFPKMIKYTGILFTAAKNLNPVIKKSIGFFYDLLKVMIAFKVTTKVVSIITNLIWPLVSIAGTLISLPFSILKTASAMTVLSGAATVTATSFGILNKAIMFSLLAPFKLIKAVLISFPMYIMSAVASTRIWIGVMGLLKAVFYTGLIQPLGMVLKALFFLPLSLLKASTYTALFSKTMALTRIVLLGFVDVSILVLKHLFWFPTYLVSAIFSTKTWIAVLGGLRTALYVGLIQPLGAALKFLVLLPVQLLKASTYTKLFSKTMALARASITGVTVALRSTLGYLFKWPVALGTAEAATTSLAVKNGFLARSFALVSKSVVGLYIRMLAIPALVAATIVVAQGIYGYLKNNIETLSWMGDKIVNAITTLGRGAWSAITFVVDALKKLYNFIKGLLFPLFEEFKTYASEMMGAIMAPFKEWFTKFVDMIKGWAASWKQELIEAIRAMEGVLIVIEEITGIPLAKWYDKVKESAKGAGEALRKEAEDIKNSVAAGVAAIQAAADAAVKKVDELKKLLSTYVPEIMAIIKTVGGEALKGVWDGTVQGFKDLISEIKKAGKKDLAFITKLFTGIFGDLSQYTDTQIAKIKKFLKELADIEPVDMKKLLSGLDEAAGTEGLGPIQKQKSFWASYLENLEKTFDAMDDLAKGIAESMENSFQTLFYDAMTFNLQSFKSYIHSFANDILKTLSEIWAKTLMMKLLGSSTGGGGWLGAAVSFVGGLFGGGGANATSINSAMDVANASTYANVAHTGGIVGETTFPKKMFPKDLFNFAPRLHKGLMKDEYPAILQKGEQVLPKNTPMQTQNVTMKVYAMDSQSFAEYMNKNARSLLGPMENMMTTSKSLRSTMRKVI